MNLPITGVAGNPNSCAPSTINTTVTPILIKPPLLTKQTPENSASPAAEDKVELSKPAPRTHHARSAKVNAASRQAEKSRQAPTQTDAAPAQPSGKAETSSAAPDGSTIKCQISHQEVKRTKPSTEATPPTVPINLKEEFAEAATSISRTFTSTSMSLTETTTSKNSKSKSVKSPPGELEQAAQAEELAQQDKLRAEEIYTRMEAERKLHLARMETILYNLQSEIQRMWEEAIVKRRKVQDELLKNWTKVMLD